MREAESDLAGRLADASNILFLEEGERTVRERVHETLLTGRAGDSNDVLVVTFSRPGPWLDAWSDQVASRDSNLGLVRLSEMDDREGRRDGAYVRSVDPNDLTGLGMAVQDFFEGAATSPNSTVVCVDSVTELAEYHSVRTLFRFLRVVTQRVTTEGAVAHYHVDPVAHDSQSLARLKPPFDAHVQVGADGVTVSQPY